VRRRRKREERWERGEEEGRRRKEGWGREKEERYLSLYFLLIRDIKEAPLSRATRLGGPTLCWDLAFVVFPCQDPKLPSQKGERRGRGKREEGGGRKEGRGREKGGEGRGGGGLLGLVALLSGGTWPLLYFVKMPNCRVRREIGGEGRRRREKGGGREKGERRKEGRGKREEGRGREEG
jgi:hypothetical protein